LQTVAEGDPDARSDGDGDITGAITDSVNYTVEEHVNWWGTCKTQRQGAETAQVESTSTDYYNIDEQLREIRETGQSVLDMASSR
jgi:twitching motility protein PilJ